MDPTEPSGERAPDRPGAGVFDPVTISRDRPRVGWWLSIVVIALILATIKPWGGGEMTGSGMASPEPTTSPAEARTAVTASPSSPPFGAGPEVGPFCLNPSAWLFATVEHWRGGTIKVWRALEPSAGASGPEDPSIPIVAIPSEGILELGWCAPVGGDQRPIGEATVTASHLTATGAKAIVLDRVRPIGVASAFGALYGPPPHPVGSRELKVWPSGRFVFHYENGGLDRWFGVDIELKPRPDRAP